MGLKTSVVQYILTQSPALISTGDARRVSVIIQNRAGSPMYIRYGSPIGNFIGSVDSVEIPAFGTYSEDINCPTEQIYAVHSAVSANVVIAETLVT